MARSRVELFEEIRKAHDREGLGIRALANRFGVHRRAVRQALASPIPPPRKQTSRPSPVLDPWKATIDRWLADDETAPRKQRHTARRVFQRLVEEEGADVGESTVRRYVGQVKRDRPVSISKVNVPQSHPAGEEAEVDFGQITFRLGGELVIGRMFIMRLSASGKAFHRIYANEAQEVFIDGHVRAFEHFGGVPGRIRYDNLKPAVTRVLRGRDRTESERFVAMRSHYGFDSFFCIPGQEGAHEKGGVEGEVGRFRRRHLVPLPAVRTLAELNELVALADERDDARHIFGHHTTVGEEFAAELPTLRALPDERFELTLALSCRVDHKSRVCVRQCFYSVPARYVGRRIDVFLGAEHVETRDGGRVVALHERAVGKGAESLCLDHYLEVLERKPGALPGATALQAARASGSFGPLHERFWDAARRKLGDAAGTRALIEVLLAHRNTNRDALLVGIERALEIGSVDPAVVLVEARRATEPATTLLVPIGSLHRFDRPAPPLSPYDELLEASS
jgi:transposase